KADHRLALPPSQIIRFANTLANHLRVKDEARAKMEISGQAGEWLVSVARDLQEHRGSSIVIPGDYQPPEVHALAHAMNHVLGNVGATVTYTDPIEVNPVDPIQSLRELLDDIKAGHVDILVIVGGNPVYTAPVDLAFAENMARVGL